MADLGDLTATIPLARLLGIELVEADREVVVARMAWDEERCTAGGILHGGALMALADTAGAVSAFLNLPAGAAGTTTIESKTNLVRAVPGGTVTARTRPLHRGRTLAVLESELTDDDGRLVAKTSQTQIYTYPR
ncbi:MAG TPA: PaaI family thioesterase [Solirubrobacterales bacterium]|nr:PaaI family thioesterase [Solirubrobacterales bacterium]